MTPARRGFPRSSRILSSVDFQRVFDNARRFKSRYFTVLVRQRAVADKVKPGYEADSRLGLAIAKKQLPRAVDRNRVKRIVRESFRLNCERLPVLDIVVMARRDCANADTATLHKSLQVIWREAAGALHSRSS